MNGLKLQLCRLSLFLLVMLAPALAMAIPFDVDVAPLYDSQNGDIAYSSFADQYLIVWQDSTTEVRGQIRRSDTTLVVDHLRLFPVSSGLRYATPRATFKSSQNLYVVIAHVSDTTTPLPRKFIQARAFDRNGALVWVRDLTNGLNAVRNPDIVADTFGSDCCILAVWEESFGSITGQQINADGTLSEANTLIFSGSSEFPPHAMNPSVTYRGDTGDVFLVAYQVNRSSGSVVEVRQVNPVGGSLRGASVVVSTMTERPRTDYGERFRAGVSVSYNGTAKRYLVAWGDNGGIRGQRLTSSAALSGAPLNLAASTDTPYAASAQGDPRDVVVVGRLSSGSGWMQTIQIDVGADRWVTLVPLRARQVIGGAAAFSPVSNQFLYTWREEELSYSTRFDVRGDALPLFLRSRSAPRWRPVSLIGAIRLDDRPRLMTHRGPVNGKIFLKFVKRYLVPWLRPGDVVVMDNLNFHKMKAVRALIEAADATPIYLPTYSPELNPIELWWADMKRVLRKLAINIEAELRQAARRLRSSLALTKIAGWFRKALREAQLK